MGQTTFDREVERLLRAFRRRRPMRAQSLIVTMLGDVASVHGGVIWLGSLIAALEPFGVAERLTRTSVFRLNKDGWIDLKRRGRRSYVQFSTHGRREYDRTASRIYAASRPAWDGNWTLVLARDVPRARSYAFRKALGWVGYGELTTGLYAHPSADRRTLIDLLDELELQDAVVVMSAQTPELASQHRLTARIQAAWRLPVLARSIRAARGAVVGIRGAHPRNSRLSALASAGSRHSGRTARHGVAWQCGVGADLPFVSGGRAQVA